MLKYYYKSKNRTEMKFKTDLSTTLGAKVFVEWK